MKKLVVGVIVLSVSLLMASAQAKTITREGSSANGWANPGGCRILVHDNQPDVLHVNCKDATAPARIRYRYLKDQNVRHAEASFFGDIEKRGGTGTVGAIRWLCEPDGPRTGRIVIPVGLYVHINSVTWDLIRWEDR